MNLAYEIWDVFTTTALSGNPLALIPDASQLTDAQMQAIAKEFNLSETSFMLPSKKADLRARFFTPYTELPMAGHPSVGTLYAAFEKDMVKGEKASLELAVGVTPMSLEITNNKLERVWMNQGVPKLIQEVPERADVAKALGLELSDLLESLPVQIVTAGNEFMLVPLASLEALAKAKVNLDLLPKGLPSQHRGVFAFTFDAPESDLRCRKLGVAEDPGTGSAHGPLGWYIAQHGLLDFQNDSLRFVSHQGVEMGRPSELHVRVIKEEAGFNVEVGGSAVKVAEGTLFL